MKNETQYPQESRMLPDRVIALSRIFCELLFVLKTVPNCRNLVATIDPKLSTLSRRSRNQYS